MTGLSAGRKGEARAVSQLKSKTLRESSAWKLKSSENNIEDYNDNERSRSQCLEVKLTQRQQKDSI